MTAPAPIESTRAGVRLHHVLVWDPDLAAAATVTRVLRRRGHQVHAVDERREADACLAGDHPDVCVLSFGGSGDMETARHVRSRFAGPVVCYGAGAGARDRIALLRTGIEDVAPNPLSYEELALRVEAVARRGEDRTATPTADDVITCGAVTADPGTLQVELRGSRTQLTAVEFSLLTFLMRNPGVAFTRRELLRRVWGYEIGDTSTVSVHVRRLRRKLEQDAAAPQMIRTVWGSGYYFDESAT